MRTKRRVADFGVGALQLAPRGGHAPCDLVEREVALVLVGDDRHRLLEEAGAQSDGGRSLLGHQRYVRIVCPRGCVMTSTASQAGASALFVARWARPPTARLVGSH